MILELNGTQTVKLFKLDISVLINNPRTIYPRLRIFFFTIYQVLVVFFDNNIL